MQWPCDNCHNASVGKKGSSPSANSRHPGDARAEVSNRNPCQMPPKLYQIQPKIGAKCVSGPLGGDVGKKATKKSEIWGDLHLQTGSQNHRFFLFFAIFWQWKKAIRTQLLRTSVFRQGSVTGPILGRSGPPFWRHFGLQNGTFLNEKTCREKSTIFIVLLITFFKKKKKRKVLKVP